MTDEMIVALYLQRSEDAIRETDAAYGRYLHYISFGILRDDEDAKETVNDTYLKAWNAIPPQHPNPLKTFLASITRRLSINRYEFKTAQKRGGGQYELALEELAECIPDRHAETDVTDSIVLRDTLNRFLRELSATERHVFIRRYWHMHTIAEIAHDFGMSQSKVKSMLMRTRQKLKARLDKEGFAV